MFSLTQRLERAGDSLMMVVEVTELFALRRISEQGLSRLSDTVVLLQYVQDGPERRRGNRTESHGADNADRPFPVPACGGRDPGRPHPGIGPAAQRRGLDPARVRARPRLRVIAGVFFLNDAAPPGSYPLSRHDPLRI